MSPQSTERLMCFLQKNTPLSPAETAELITRFVPLDLKENEYFLKSGMPVHQIGYLAAGILRRYIIDEKGNEVIQQFITEDHFFADIDGFYFKTTSGSYIQSITPCRLLILSINDLEILTEDEARLKLIIAHIGIQNMLEWLKTIDLLRTGNCTEKYQTFIRHYPQLSQQLLYKHIASYLGITQQSFSRIRKQMQ